MLRSPDLDLPLDHPDRELLSAITQRLDVPADRLRLVDSLSEYVQQALEVTPEVRDAPRQQALTDRFLTPVLPGLEALLLDLRAELDPALREAQPTFGSKPYPLGQCLEITQAVQRRLESLDPARLSGAAAQACAALRDFRAAGGEVRRAWGDLRGQYFQNALIVGTLYVDVANDTVVITKPPVEICAFAEADFRPIADHIHFADIAWRYWDYQILPNHVLPQLAPYLPLMMITPNGGFRLGPTDPYMLGLTLADRFSTSERALGALTLSSVTCDSLSAALRDGPIPVAASAEAGREAALAACRTFRAEGRSGCAESFNHAMVAAREVNRRLARLMAVPLAA